MHVRYPILPLVAVFTAACVAVQLWFGTYATDRSLTGDEAAHFVNGLLVFDWLRQAPSSNPLAFAKAYYVHFPRVSIGHWPPLFYVLQAGFFAIAGRSSGAALGLQALIAGLACAWPAHLVQRRLGWLAGIATGVFVLASPELFFLINAVMLDTMLALWIMAAALCWARFARRPDNRWALLFAGTASAAILTKGNGFCLAFLPLLHAAMTRRAAPLRDRRAWLAAFLVAIATLPWTVLTWGMTKAGFNYGWGLAYACQALPAYIVALVRGSGAAGIILFCIGLGRQFRARPSDETVSALAAAALSVLLFQSIVPADITPRYLVALVPASAVPIAMGAASLARLVPRPGLNPAATMLLLLLCAAAIFVPRRPAAYAIADMAEHVLAARDPNGFVLVSGTPRAEGAIIADFAERDPGRTHYVLRSSQLLSQSGFMGQAYTPRFNTAQAASQFLAGSGIGWLILQRPQAQDMMAHDRQLQDAADLAGWPMALHLPSPQGEMTLYRLQNAAPTAEQRRALLLRATPNGALQNPP